MKYVNNWGLAPHFKDLLKTKVQNSKFLVISIDESLNKSTQNCQWILESASGVKKQKQVEVRYWDSQFLGHTTSGDLLENFSKSLFELDVSKIIQISMDGPIAWCLNDKVVKNIEEMELHQFVNIGSCGLQIIPGSFKTGIEFTYGNIKATAKSTFQILHDSPSRKTDYISVSRSNTFSLFFCATRWVEANRLLNNYWKYSDKSQK